MTKKKITLIDGYGFVFRAYHSLPPLTRDDGTPTGAVYGFTNMLLRLLAGLDSSHICMVFDSGSKTFRNDIDPNYKANRPPCPDDLIPQFPLIREAAEAFNLHIVEKVGYEADDLIATIAKDAAKKDFEVVIVSSDKDLMQLVDGNINMYDAMKNRIIGTKEVEEKFLVPPTQVLDVLSLMGDASDNVPGVRGIGPKIAAELISNYGTLENLLENLNEIKQNKRRESLQGGVEAAKLSKKLITLCETVPIDLDMDQFKAKDINPEELVQFLSNQGFRALKQRIIKEFSLKSTDFERKGKENDTSSKKTPVNELKFDKISKIKINTAQNLEEIITKLEKLHAFIIDIEFDKNDKNLARNIIFSPISDNLHDKTYQISIKNNNLRQNNEVSDLFSIKNEEKPDLDIQIPLENVLESLKIILLDGSILKIGYKIKEIYKFFAKNGINMAASEDIATMSYILNSASNKSHIRNLIDLNLDEDIEENDFGLAFDDLEKDKEPKLFEDSSKKEQFYYFKNYAIWSLYNLLKQRIFENNLNFVYHRFENPLLPVLAKMELEGVQVDKMKLKSLSSDFDLIIKKLTKEIHDLAKEEFNIASPKQLSEVLFEKLSLPGKKSKTGSFSTNSDILEDLELAGHEIAGKVLQWRHISKLKSTYSDALQDSISPETGRIHTNFSNISTSTGRLSSSNPNIQNIPIRTSEGRKIRTAFVAKKGHKLILADYSQIELRVLAHISDIKALKEAFKEDKDIHAITASQIFEVDEDKVDSEMRRKAKAINFGIIYGISAFGLARQLKIDRGDASNYIKSYLITYPGIKEFMSGYQELAKEQGYVSTITGRKCFINGIDSKNPVIKGLAERLAINAPIQGSAADIIKKAMIDLDNKLENSNFKAKMLLQVHDELILEAPEDEVEQVQNLLKKTMQNAFLLDLPLKVDVKVSDCW